MSIESEIFKRSKPNYKKLLNYGFIDKNTKYEYERNFLDDEFKAVIIINEKEVIGKVVDQEYNAEYTNFRVESKSGKFASIVREEYIKILEDINEKCFEKNYFIYEQANRINNKICKRYKTTPEFPWEETYGHGVYRNEQSKKWYAIIMNLDKSKLTTESGEVEVLNVKLPKEKIEKLKNESGYYEAYHMNKKSWISIILDNTLEDNEILSLIDESYNLSYNEIKNNKENEWIIPTNPKYFDITHVFDESKEVLWPQKRGIKKNDIIYVYVAAPYSSIMYKCIAIEDNIKNNYFTFESNSMLVKLLDEYPKDRYSFNLMKKYKVNAVRGPRHITKELSELINKEEKKQKKEPHQ